MHVIATKQATCTVAYSMHGMNISVLGQRSSSQGQKQKKMLPFRFRMNLAKRTNFLKTNYYKTCIP